MLRSHVDGIIYVGLHDRHIDYIINPISKPVVFAFSHGTSDDHYVTYNNYDSAVNATNYLIDRGHQDIALIAGHPNSFPTHERLKGFKSAIEKAGLQTRDEFIRFGDWEYDTGFQITRRLLSLPHRPSAIFAMNDLMATGCLNSAQEFGLQVPRDLSIIGFDNREISRYLPVPLTTIQLPNREIGHESARMLLALIDNIPIEQNSIILSCSLIERASVSSVTIR